MPQNITYPTISAHNINACIHVNDVDVFCRLINSQLENLRVSRQMLGISLTRIPPLFLEEDIKRVYNLILLYNGRTHRGETVSVYENELCNVICCRPRNLNSTLVRIRKILNFLPLSPKVRKVQDKFELIYFPIVEPNRQGNRYRFFFQKYHLIYEGHTFIYQNITEDNSQYNLEQFISYYIQGRFTSISPNENQCGCLECQNGRRDWFYSRTHSTAMSVIRQRYVIPSEWNHLFDTPRTNVISQSQLPVPLFFKNAFGKMPSSVVFALSTT